MRCAALESPAPPRWCFRPPSTASAAIFAAPVTRWPISRIEAESSSAARRDRLHIGGGLFGRRGDGGCLPVGLVGAAVHQAGVLFELRGRMRDAAHDTQHLGLETVGKLLHGATLLGLGVLFLLGLLDFEPLHRDAVLLEHFDGACHRADFVGAVRPGTSTV